MGMVIVIFLTIFASRFVKVGPNQVLIISGRQYRIIGPDGQPRIVGYRLVSGGGTFVWPVFEKADVLSLETISVEMRGLQISDSQRATVVVDAVAQVKVRGDEVSIRTAADNLLSRAPDEIGKLARQIIEGHLRTVVSVLKADEVVASRDVVLGKVKELAEIDLLKLGLTANSFVFHDIRCV